ncbi:MAG: hypothetical protein OEU32_18480 [Acidimicrobiia bacterium]|nr:hypothetical protein [Acidimicrobiia bacterium]
MKAIGSKPYGSADVLELDDISGSVVAKPANVKFDQATAVPAATSTVLQVSAPTGFATLRSRW